MPRGYTLAAAAFWLEGPHPCSGTESSPKRAGDVYAPGSKGKPGGVGTYSDCFEDRRDAASVTWRFSIQGDDSYITGAAIVFPDIPPLRIETNGTVKGRGKLVTHWIQP